MAARRGVVLAAVVLWVAAAAPAAAAHAGLVASDPSAGATLGASPSAVELSFSERVLPSVSSVRILGASGSTYQVGSPTIVSSDPLSLRERVAALPRGVYTVEWRVVSAVDGHATSGDFGFGVGVAPTGAAAGVGHTNASASSLEILARWLLLLGLTVLLGAAAASAARFGGSPDDELTVALVGWLLAVAGLAALAAAQVGNAHASVGAVLATSVGHAFVWRAAAIAAAGIALAVAYRARRIHRRALLACGGATGWAIVVHVAAGHAASTSWSSTLTIAIQVAHFCAAGIWIGGLCALLFGLRGVARPGKAAAVRRFSTVAGVGIVVVGATGIARAFSALSTVDDLVSTGYGRAVFIKGALLVGIALLGARNRWWNVPRADTALGPLRRTSRGELILAGAALAAAAVLGASAPPGIADLVALRGFNVTGADYGTSIRVDLTTPSSQPGPNRYVVRLSAYDTGAVIEADHVTLTFAPIDDPEVAPTLLSLAPGPDHTFVGTGANLAFVGRWEVTVVIERDGSGVDVPLELDTPSPQQFVSKEQIPGRPPAYTVQVGTFGSLGYVRISPQPDRAGVSRIVVTCFDSLDNAAQVSGLVLTAGAPGFPTDQVPVSALGPDQFAGRVRLRPGADSLTVVAHTLGGERLWATVTLRVPRSTGR
jgi:copper transport protein